MSSTGCKKIRERDFQKEEKACEKIPSNRTGSSRLLSEAPKLRWWKTIDESKSVKSYYAMIETRLLPDAKGKHWQILSKIHEMYPNLLFRKHSDNRLGGERGS